MRDNMNIFHYDNRNNKYKAFDIHSTDEDDAVFVSLTEGVKNANRDRIVIKLTKKELAYVILESQEIYRTLDLDVNEYEKKQNKKNKKDTKGEDGD